MQRQSVISVSWPFGSLSCGLVCAQRCPSGSELCHCTFGCLNPYSRRAALRVWTRGRRPFCELWPYNRTTHRLLSLGQQQLLQEPHAATALPTRVAQLMLRRARASLCLEGTQCWRQRVQPWQWPCGRLVAACCAWDVCQPPFECTAAAPGR